MRISATYRIGLVLALLVGSLVLVSAPKGPFTENHKAYYLSAEANEMIRPGLSIKLSSPQIGADGTLKVTVKVTDPKGAPLDRDGIQTPGAVSTSLMIARIPKGATQYVAYTTRVQTSPITGKSEAQASADSGGSWVKVADGQYTYTFGTKLPADYDKTVTHTIGAWGSRNITEFGLGTQYDDDWFNFVPNGSAVTVTRDVVGTTTCNACHTAMGFHGGSRRSMEVCVLCHTPQSADPDTGNTVDLPVMIHKIHMGLNLPSVLAGGKYTIIGNAQSVNDYSGVNFPATPRSCDSCHQPGPAQAANIYKPTRAACGSCHDNVNFATGENHLDLPQVSDNMCANCHPKQGELEFDASIIGAHTIPTEAKGLAGVNFEIVEVQDAVPGKKPTIVFSIKDNSGTAIPPSKMSRLSVYWIGPNTDFTRYVSESALTADGTPDGRAWWTFGTVIPADWTGSVTFAVEGRRSVKLMEGTKKEQTLNEAGINKQLAVSLSGAKATPRRTIASIDKCNACHGFLSFHGGSRNRVEQCAICHNPTFTAGSTSVSLDFKVMIHKIHMGTDLTQPYKVGTTWTANTLGYPGIRSSCTMCHVNGSEQLPLPDGVSEVKAPANFLNPMGAETAACTACHDSKVAASHALSNTKNGVESCSVCHGPNGEFSVNKMHAQ